MKHRILAPSLLGALAACHATAPATTPSSSTIAEIVLDQVQRDIHQLIQAALLDHLGSPADPVHSAGIDEFNFRVATLNETLTDLLIRMPAPAGTNAVATNASIRTESNDTAVAALQSGLTVVERMHELCVQNLINVNTVGYHKRTLQVTNERDEASGLIVPRACAELGVMTQGTLEVTERELDVAIDGDGFFRVLAADSSVRFTRNGSFQLNADGMLVTGSGLLLEPNVHVPQDTLEISFDPNGQVSGRTASHPNQATTFGHLELARFVNPGQLVPTGDNALRATPAAGAPSSGQPGSTGFGILKQGFLERSNVQTLNELVNMQVIRRQHATLRRALAVHGVFVR